jgi:Ring finger domain
MATALPQGHPAAAAALPTREPTALRSSLADHVRRRLLPAHRFASVALVLAELAGEAAVLVWDHGRACDRPLRFWLVSLMLMQAAVVLITCISMRLGGRGWRRGVDDDALSPHRLGLSASDAELYMSAPGAAEPVSSLPLPRPYASLPLVQEPNVRSPLWPPPPPPPPSTAIPLSGDNGAQLASAGPAAGPAAPVGHTANYLSAAPPGPSPFSSTSSLFTRGNVLDALGNDNLDAYLRSLNGMFLMWMVMGVVFVSDKSTCSATAPHLYRLTVALTFIYFALLLLPLTCFCLIVCCLPMFIIAYRVLLPFTERERRRARAAGSELIASLPCAPYVPPDRSGTGEGAGGYEHDGDESCVICLSTYQPAELVKTLPCAHNFHRSCIDQWLVVDRSCPMCKRDVDQRQPRASGDDPAPGEFPSDGSPHTSSASLSMGMV